MSSTAIPVSNVSWAFTRQWEKENLRLPRKHHPNETPSLRWRLWYIFGDSLMAKRERLQIRRQLFVLSIVSIVCNNHQKLVATTTSSCDGSLLPPVDRLDHGPSIGVGNEREEEGVGLTCSKKPE